MITANILKQDDKYHVSNYSMNYDDRTQVINHYDTFCIFDRWGNIFPQGKKAHGIFHKGTRYLNHLYLAINNRRPMLLSSCIRQDNEILSVDLTNPDLHDCGLPENSVHINREQFIRNGVYYEEVNVSNFQETNCDMELSIEFGADFVDIFEVRGMTRNVEKPAVIMSSTEKCIRFEYTGLDHIRRTTEIRFRETEDCYIQDSRVFFPLKISNCGTAKIEFVMLFKTDGDGIDEYKMPEFSKVKKDIQEDLKSSQAKFASIDSNNENFNNWLTRSLTDIQSLMSKTRYGMYPYAGVPWYNTAFGRDGIITAMQLLWMSPDIGKEALLFLAQTQAKELDAAKDAEPGKIIHEMRSSEMANTGEVPFSQYYGTIDATPLFLMLAGMYYMQTADSKTIRKIWKNIKAAADWIDDYGDVDGDGFVEYKNKSKDGLTNQGWKDSHDSIMYEDGNYCEAPIALCEVQAYVYAAKKYTATLATVMEEPEYAKALDDAANTLKKEFNDKFWDEQLGTFVLALDGSKQPCRVASSNAGHCLFAGIADERHAERLAETLTGKTMFSGWGIRTLASSEVRYNPMSYHNGSIWPHDNALIASGLARYGYTSEAIKVMRGLFDASMFLDLQRLPELFCGFDRRPKEGPTDYPVACSPQAWAVGAVFLLLQSCLQMQIDGVHKIIIFNKPSLPEFIKHLRIANLNLGEDHCFFEVFRHDDEVSFRIVYKPDDWEFVIKQ